MTSDSVAKGSTVVDEYRWLCSELVNCAQVQKSLLAMRVPTWGGRTVPSKSPKSCRPLFRRNRPFVVDEVKSLWQAALMPEL